MAIAWFTTQVTVKSFKISVAIEAVNFKTDHVPPKGTPKSTLLKFDYKFTVSGGDTLSATIKAGAIQRLVETIAVNPGGFVLVSGKLVSGRIEEVGLSYQPPKPVVEAVVPNRDIPSE